MVEELVTQLIGSLKIWAKKQNSRQFSDFYLFGSLLNGSGNQFLPDKSDIDLVVILKDPIKDPLSRSKVCQKLRKSKLDLEAIISKILKRRVTAKPVVSLVLVTSSEVSWDIHKSKSLKFFRDNKGKSVNLLEASKTLKSVGIRNREALLDVIQAIEKAQDYRNRYLSIIPDKFKEYKEQDVFPKDLARSAAQVHSFDVKNEADKFDINCGNSYLISLLYKKVSRTNNEWSRLNSKVGERAGRGRKPPALDDFDLLLLHELLFDKAFKLLKRSFSITLTKGRHPPKSKGVLPKSPASKLQSEKVLKTKVTAGASLSPQKVSNSKNSTTRSSRAVRNSKNWIMLDHEFFQAQSSSAQSDKITIFHILPKNLEESSKLKALQPKESYSPRLIAYADLHEAGNMQVLSVMSESKGGKTIFNITLTPNQQRLGNSFGREGTYYGYDANQIAELRAKQILLGQALPAEIERSIPTQITDSNNHTKTIGKGIFPELWEKLQTQSNLFLPKAWLWAAYYLKMSHVIEDILELELGPIENKIMPVKFWGRRERFSTNQEPTFIRVAGNCTLSK